MTVIYIYAMWFCWHTVMVPIDEEMLYSQLSACIRERREALGKTQAELADGIGVLRTSINNIEKGRQRPPLHMIYRIAEELDFEVRDLLPERAVVTTKELVGVEVNGEVLNVLPKTAEVLQRVLYELHARKDNHDT